MSVGIEAQLVDEGAFVGRGAEIAAIRAALEEARLVRLVGPGGVGKTRIAVELSRQPEAVLCDLAEVHDDAGACDAVARALSLAPDAAGDDIARVGRALAARDELLLILDGADQVSAALLQRWMALAPELSMVVTSRARPGAATEHVIEVAPLPPEDALDLLRRRAERAGAPLTEQDLPFAAQLVAEIEGFPLAIALCAARLPLMDARALLHRLRSGGGTHGLEAAIESAWLACGDAEQRALSECSVFAGGFTVEAAEAVLTGPAGDVVGLLSALRDKSLLRATTRDGQRRLDMYGAVRAFAAARLQDREVPARHAQHYAALGTALEARANAGEVEARRALDRERPNLMAVIERALAQPALDARAAEPALRALLAIARDLDDAAPLAQLTALVSPVLEATRNSGADPRLIAQAYALRGRLCLHGAADDSDAAARDLLHALSAATTLGDRGLEATVLCLLGDALRMRGALEEACDHYRRAGDIHAALGQLAARNDAEEKLAWAHADAGDTGAARTLLERIAARHGTAGDAEAEAIAMIGVAAIDLDEAKHGDARARCREARDPSRTPRCRALAQMWLSRIDHDTGRLAEARAGLEQSRLELQALGRDDAAAVCTLHLGVLCRELGHAAEAHALLEAARPRLRGDARAMASAHLAALERAAGDRPRAEALIAAAQREAVSPRARAVIAATGVGPGGSPPAPGVGGCDLRAALRCLGKAARAEIAPRDALLIARDGRWFRPPGGERVSLERRKPLMRLLARLASERVAGGPPLPWDVLAAAGWPGEKVIPSAAAHRVRVAVSSLRKLGLRDVILTSEEGYRLDPSRDTRLSH